MDNIDKKEKKSQQNRSNYLRRKSELVERSRENRTRIKKELAKARRYSPRNSIHKWVHRFFLKVQGLDFSIQRAFLILLVIACTFYLLTETVSYLREVEGNSTQAWLKAFISEGLMIAFSWRSFRTFSLRAARKLILFGMCAYSLAAISGRVVLTSQRQVTSSTVNQKLIQDLEKDIVRKEVIYKEYLEKGFIGALRKQEKQLDSLRFELSRLRQESTQLQAPHLIEASLITLLAFRLIVMLANMILISQLSSSFRKPTSSQAPTLAKGRPNLVLVSG